jgi:heme-degrading monooxygenase HmoA
MAPARYLLITHWDTNEALPDWLKSGVIDQLSAYGETTWALSIPIRHDPGERDYLRADGLQRDAVH